MGSCQFQRYAVSQMRRYGDVGHDYLAHRPSSWKAEQPGLGIGEGYSDVRGQGGWIQRAGIAVQARWTIDGNEQWRAGTLGRASQFEQPGSFRIIRAGLAPS
jgi:hypothetical protein